MVAAPAPHLRGAPRVPCARRTFVGPVPGGASVRPECAGGVWHAARGDPVAAAIAWAGAAAPVRRSVARIAGRIVATRSWERLGFARLRDYAVERAGVSAREIQDQARVDRALCRLPAIDAAFTSGRLTWTKTRLLCRVATRANEEAWLRFAASVTAAALAREVRGTDAWAAEAGGAGGGDAESMDETDEDGVRHAPHETVFLHCTPETRAKWFRARRFARAVAGEVLPTWAAMEAIAAEVLSALPLEVEPGGSARAAVAAAATAAAAATGAGRDRGPKASPRAATAASRDEESGEGESSERERRRDASGVPQPQLSPLEAQLAELTAGLDGAGPFELDARWRRAVRLEQRLWGELAPHLLEVACGRRYRELGLRSMDAFARERLGMSPRRCQMLLRLERACGVCPELRRAFREGRLSWVQAHALVPVLIRDEAGPWRRAWLEHARRVSVRRLEDDVDRALEKGAVDPVAVGAAAGVAPLASAPRPVDAQVGGAVGPAGPQIGARPGTVGIHFRAPRDVARLFRAVLATVQRRLERARGRPASEGEALDAMLEHALVTWVSWGGGRDAQRAHRVFERDGWRCTAPGCSSYRNLHDHHVRFRSAGGGDELANRTTLCAWHHLRGVHAGLVRCAGRAPDGLHFVFGLRPGSGLPPLVHYGPGEVLLK